MSIHINHDPYNVRGPAACGNTDQSTHRISARVAATIVEQGIAPLSGIRAEQLCPTCLEQMDDMLWEINQTRREEAREQDERATTGLAGFWPEMPSLSGIDIFADRYGPPSGEPSP